MFRPLHDVYDLRNNAASNIMWFAFSADRTFWRVSAVMMVVVAVDGIPKKK